MPRKGANISLSSYDDIFSTEESREAASNEQVQQIPISELHPFEGHPFRVVDDEAMMRTMESISQYGVIAPLLARPDPDGGYEIISGHRRCHAAGLVGLETLPVIVREMDEDEAIITMVDSNLQRETILPSERAWAYKLKLDAMKHQGARSDLTSTQVDGTVTVSYLIHKEASIEEGISDYIELEIEITLKTKVSGTQIDEYNTQKDALIEKEGQEYADKVFNLSSSFPILNTQGIAYNAITTESVSSVILVILAILMVVFA